MGIVLYTDSLFVEHVTPPGHPECSDRARVVVEGLQDCPLVSRRVAAAVGDPADVARVHDAAYVAAIQAVAEQGGGSLDPDTWVSPRSYQVALAASGTLCEAADAAITAGERSFAVVRPPGHHARPAKGMGFCLFNNVAVAAARAQAVHGLERVAVVDFDVHHGNGTQEMFWRAPGVFYLSLHRDRFYPGTGHADETGEGDGKGTTLNLPLDGDTPAEEYKVAFQSAMDRLVSWKPQLVLASAGFDAYDFDPIGGLGLEAEHFQWIGAQLRAAADASCEGRLVGVLEGGYDLDALGELVRRFVEGMDAGA